MQVLTISGYRERHSQSKWISIVKDDIVYRPHKIKAFEAPYGLVYGRNNGNSSVKQTSGAIY